jgi:hypothetical protein
MWLEGSVLLGDRPLVDQLARGVHVEWVGVFGKHRYFACLRAPCHATIISEKFY